MYSATAPQNSPDVNGVSGSLSQSRSMYLQTYTQTVTISNNLGATVDASIRCGSSDRYTVVPTSFSLKPGHSCNVEVCLRVLKYAQKRKAAEQGQRDIFHIKVFPQDDGFPLLRAEQAVFQPIAPFHCNDGFLHHHLVV